MAALVAAPEARIKTAAARAATEVTEATAPARITAVRVVVASVFTAAQVRAVVVGTPVDFSHSIAGLAQVVALAAEQASVRVVRLAARGVLAMAAAQTVPAAVAYDMSHLTQ